MKIKIKNFVFAGFAAAMFAGAAYAEPVSTTPQPYDLDNEHNLNYVTSKKYVDRVVTNAKADTTALAGRVTTIENSAAYNSGITSAKVTQYDNYATNKQDKADSTVAANGNYIVAGSDVKTNLGNLDTQVKANADAIATKASSSDLTTLAGRVTTAESNISLKQNEADSNVAQAGNYIAAGHGVASNLTALDTRAKTNADNISTNTTNIGTLGTLTTSNKTNLVSAINEVNTAATNAATAGQPKSDDNLLAGTLNGQWVSIDAEDETANTCDSTHPCVWVNNVWTPIQQ